MQPERGPQPGGGGDHELTRRGLIARGGFAALTLAGTPLVAAIAAEQASAQSEGAAASLGATLGLENTLVVVYAAARDSGRLSGADLELARVFGRQAAARAKLLAEALGPEAPAASSARPKRSQIPGLGSVRSARRYLEIAGSFENQVYLGYLDALDATAERATIRLLTQLAASTAQHLALLRSALGRVPAPSAFETGLSV